MVVVLRMLDKFNDENSFHESTTHPRAAHWEDLCLEVFSASFIDQEATVVFPPRNKIVNLRDALKHVTISGLGRVQDIATEPIKTSAHTFRTPAEARCVTGAANNATLDYFCVEEATIFGLANAILTGFGINLHTPSRSRLLGDLKSDSRVAISKFCDYERKKFVEANRAMFSNLQGSARAKAFSAHFKSMLDCQS
ncbi:hypothetical protein Y032_0355g3320 [Ancylostoma ceylanicum]|uniref:Uncharacterized protein n=1 Tax=Ancylostoma ceylanicum TaxID=53326 RepID=A0A016RX08_9BILA|nr:hypothetical protein Y032_0355g3320 [Ancylostoma ceylanicum]